MAKAKVYNLAGEVVSEQELNPSVFSVNVKPVVVQQVVVAQRANARKSWAHTKQRGEVRGGGRKPWKQKGTGRARHGSIRSPLWKGGAITFGPRTERNYAKSVNKKMKKKAMRMVLSDKLANEQLILVESLALPEVKTKQVEKILKALPLKGHKSLFVLDGTAENMALSTRNLADAKSVHAGSINVVDLMSAQSVIVSLKALEGIEKLFASNK